MDVHVSNSRSQDHVIRKSIYCIFHKLYRTNKAKSPPGFICIIFRCMSSTDQMTFKKLKCKFIYDKFYNVDLKRVAREKIQYNGKKF